MNLNDIEALENAAYTCKLGPTVARELGPDSQVWGLEIKFEKATSRNWPVVVALYRDTPEHGPQAVTVPFSAFEIGSQGITLSNFTTGVYDALRGAGVHVTKKTRLLLYLFNSVEPYSVLDLYDLDERFRFNPSGGDNFSVAYHDKKSGHSLEIVDMQAYFPGEEIEKVLKTYGMADLTTYARKVTRARVTDPALLIWAENAARLNFKLIDRLRADMLAEYQIDPAVYRTPGALSARVYTSRHLKKPVGLVRKYIRHQAMRSYWGGRAEAFMRGSVTGDINTYDAVSMYPSAAIQLGQMPTEYSWVRLGHSNIDRMTAGLCSVEFQFPGDELHPCLPVHGAGRLYYPLSGTSHCTLHELRYALELGARVKLLEGYGYNYGDTSLAEYSADLLSRKNAADARGDMPSRKLYKMLLNSLYGKFGQHRREYDLNDLRAVCRMAHYPSISTLLDMPNWEQVAGDLAAGGRGPAFKEKITMGGQWSPEWAALIQGYARMTESRAMRDYVALAGTTDSVILNGDAGDSFEIAGITFKREARATRATIIRSRLYALDLGDGEIKAALHGCPDLPNMPEAILNWDGCEEMKVPVRRIRRVREGLTDGQRLGVSFPSYQTVNCRWDDKRSLLGNYSEPPLMAAGE